MSLFTSYPSISLAQSDVHGLYDSLFLFGETLASLHKDGLLLSQLHLHSMVFSQTKGGWVVTDWEKVTRVAVTPQIMMGQFIELSGVIEEKALIALIGGYVQKSYGLIDPLFPGYTDALLKLLYSGPITSVNRPQKIIDIEKILAGYGGRIVFSDKAALLSLDSSFTKVKSATDKELIIATVVFMLAGIHTREWIKHIEIKDKPREVTTILSAFTRGDQMNEGRFTGIIPKLFGSKSPKERVWELIRRQPIPLLKLLALIGAFYCDPKMEKSTINEGISLLPLLKQVTDELSAQNPGGLEAEERLESLNGVVDGFDSLAKLADAQVQREASMELAQASQLILQWLSGIWEGTENRLITASCREQAYSWQDVSSLFGEDLMPLFKYMAFAGSISNTEIQAFVLSTKLFKAGKISNHLWTTAWRAIKRQRHILKLAHGCLIGEIMKEEQRNDYLMMLTFHVKKHLNSLHQHLQAVTSTVEMNKPCSWILSWSNADVHREVGETILRREFTTSMALMESLEGEGLSSKTQDLFHKLIDILNAYEE